jgi:hypothetical protein
MEKIIDYTVESRLTEEALATIVVLKMELGWQPKGGVSTAYMDPGVLYSQAMVKYEEKK